MSRFSYLVKHHLYSSQMSFRGKDRHDLAAIMETLSAVADGIGKLMNNQNLSPAVELGYYRTVLNFHLEREFEKLEGRLTNDELEIAQNTVKNYTDVNSYSSQ